MSRTRRATALLVAWITVATLAPALTASSPASAGEAPLARAVEAVELTVSDLERSSKFFTDVLSFEVVSEAETAGTESEHLEGVFGLRMRRARLRLGGETIVLAQYLAPEGRPLPPDSRSNDRWFQHVAIVVRDMDAAYTWLRSHNVRHASSGPQRLPDWNPNAGGIEAFYFKDPDGHALEVIHFPPGKGDPRWQAHSEKLFLGIDHTAIVVNDTETSLRFYRDGLGMKVAGASENHGVEQEHLNNIFGARLRITSLRAAAGPGIELLEYLAPRDGRPYPADTRGGDLWQWQTHLAVDDPQEAMRAARPAGGAWISPGAVTLPDDTLGFRRGGLVRDPDGHALLFSEH